MEDFIVTIQGSGFSEVTWRNMVNISTVRGPKEIRFATTVLSATPTELTVKIDANNKLPGRYAIAVTVNNITSTAINPLEISTPWSRLNDKPMAGVGSTANFEIDGKIFVCTGTSAPSTSDYTSQLWEYNLSTDTWTRKADFPGGPRVDAFAFSINGKGYVGAGLTATNQSISDLWQYDPMLDVWTQKTGIPQGDRAGALTFTYDNKGYVIFGTHGSGWMKRNDFWYYNPMTDVWTQLPDFAGNARLQAALCIRNNKLFVIGGFDSNTSFKSDSWSFNFATQQWSFIDYIDFQPQAYFFDDQKCYVLALSFNNFQENELNLFEYSPETNVITASRPLFPGEFRFKPGLAILKNNKIYVGLGATYGGYRFLNDLWVYPLTK
jgi:N-acetylneuraminic acid mutarotase